MVWLVPSKVKGCGCDVSDVARPPDELRSASTPLAPPPVGPTLQRDVLGWGQAPQGARSPENRAFGAQ